MDTFDKDNPVTLTLEELYAEREERYARIDRLLDEEDPFAVQATDDLAWEARLWDDEIEEAEMRAMLADMEDE